MVYRVYTERKPGLRAQADALLNELNNSLGLHGIRSVRMLNRYDVENIDTALFNKSVGTVFSEPQTDDVLFNLPDDADATFGVEFLPGQYDQRADSAAQCIQIISGGERPTVRSARIYLLYGNVSADDIAAVKKHLINAVESREASLELPQTLEAVYERPADIAVISGFTQFDDVALAGMIKDLALAMDLDDIRFCREYFSKEHRDPTLTEIRMIDTYWSDHCRHTTFNTVIDSVDSQDKNVTEAYHNYLEIRAKLGRKKPVTLMDIATIGAKYLKMTGQLTKVDDSDEINACTVNADVITDDGTEKYLIFFKNETHNHPTEIEPFGGAATCIGGAIRDPLSGRGYVYQAMRVTGAADPLKPLSETIHGKLPQKKIVTAAADGYSSYGNQIGLATGLVNEIYHEGYAAKRMEIGAVVGAAPKANVRRDIPQPDDIVVLLGGRTGRDGCGGATGSSKSHTVESLETCGAEVQKGNAPEERKLQRLFRNPEAARMIKRCNDFGAGGVSVAIGELADGLIIDLDTVPKKYEGLDGTELAISESQERMAVVLSPEDEQRFMELAASENLEATVVAVVTESKRLVMKWRGKVIVDIDREFLNSNGAEKHIDVVVQAPSEYESNETLIDDCDFAGAYRSIAGRLNVCSARGLAERFDSTIGAGTVLMPFGGQYQLTPSQAMAAKVPTHTTPSRTCTVMAYGADPFLAQNDCFNGARKGVYTSVAKLIAAGAPVFDGENCYFSFQEYFERLNRDSTKWGKPFSALLGALNAQLELGIAAIGGKDSMSGSFEKLSVPPTLVSFAISMADIDDIITPELKSPNDRVYLIEPSEFGQDGGVAEVEMLRAVSELIKSKKIISAYVPGEGGVAAAVMNMCFGNMLGFAFEDGAEALFKNRGLCIVAEASDELPFGQSLGKVTDDGFISKGDMRISLKELLDISEAKLETVFPLRAKTAQSSAVKPSFSITDGNVRRAPSVRTARPKVVIPVFPGTNCEYDTANAFEAAGALTETVVITNLTPADVSDSALRMRKAIDDAQIVFIPGGFSGGDEPDGSGKFITAFFRNPLIAEGVTELLEKRDGLMGGICNGFQALIKLGLVPFGKICEANEHSPTLTYNTIGRHVSRLVTTRVASNMSPWYSDYSVGELHTMPVSHGEGRFICSQELFDKLAANGQIATQYVSPDGEPSMDIRFNPNGSFNAVEGITSPDGRIFGKMGHSERFGAGLYKNVPNDDDRKLFSCGVAYFTK